MLAAGQDRTVLTNMLFGDALVLLGKEMHGEVHAIKLAAWNCHVARLLGSASQNYCVMFGHHIVDGNRGADLNIGAEFDPFGPHL